MFDYNPATGQLVRRYTTSSRAQRGDLVGCKNALGYLVVRIGPKLYLCHRIIWLWMTGDWPAADVDHINRDRRDNRWDNLRDVTRSVNLHNKQIDSGCYWAARDAVWVAAIQVAGVKTHIGQHKDRDVAEAMYAKAKQEYLP